jgi:CPA1 family monovalent cation:H+ antiporter
MPEPSFILSEEAIILLLFATAIILSVVLAKIRFPYTIGLVIIGYVLAAFIAPAIPFLAPLAGFVPSSDVILFLFLPPLIFEAAITLDSRLLSINFGSILLLAILGLVISTIVVGVLLVYVTPLPLILALLFGALVSATDPVTVISLFRDLGVPRKLRALVEGESLFNDASAIVVFNLIIGFVLVQSTLFSPTIIGITGEFILNLAISFVGGIAIGGLLALAVKGAIRASPGHHHIHQTVSLVVAYSAFMISQLLLGFSGVIAVLTAGIVVSRMTSEEWGIDHRQELSRFWEYIGFLADTLIFLLVGLSITSLTDPVLFTTGFALAAVLVIIAVLAARAVSVYGLFSLINLARRKRKVPLSYQTVIFWGGLRGAVALALVLALPLSLPYRDMIVGFTIIVVIFTILVCGTTVGPLIRVLGLSRPEAANQFEKLWLGLEMKKRSVSALRESAGREEQILPGRSVEETVQHYEETLKLLRQEFSLFWNRLKESPDAERIGIFFRLAAIDEEKRRYLNMYIAGLIPGPVMDQLLYNAEVRYDQVQLTGRVSEKGDYFPFLVRAGRRIKSIVNTFPRSGRYVLKEQKVEGEEMIFRSYASFTAAYQTGQWITGIAKDTGAEWEVIDQIIREYHRMYLESKAEFATLSSRYPELLKDVYHYIAERSAIAAGKELLSSAGSDPFVTGEEIEAETAALVKEESRVSRRLKER